MARSNLCPSSRACAGTRPRPTICHRFRTELGRSFSLPASNRFHRWRSGSRPCRNASPGYRSRSLSSTPRALGSTWCGQTGRCTSLNDALDYGAYTSEQYRWSNLQLAVASDGEDAFDVPQSSPDHGRRIAAYYYWNFPNTMFNFYPWGLSINIVRPLGPDRTKVSFLPFVWRPDKLGIGAGADLDRVEREDEAIVELVQRGVRSRFYDRGRFSVAREGNVHHFHRLLAESLTSSS